MDEITLFARVRPDASELADDDWAAARARLLAAAADEQVAGRSAPSRRLRRARFAAVPVAAAVIVAAAVALWPGQHGSAGTAATRATLLRPDAHALAFTTAAGYITVIVHDPLADQASYNAEFKAHGLDITMSLVPVSPSLVGTVVEMSTSGTDGNPITTITATGRCWTGGGGSQCPVGLRVPVGYRGQANIVFGRAANPGERFESTGPANAPGEAMYGMTYIGDRVSAVVAMLRQRHVTVPVFHYTTPSGIGELLPPSQVPGTWYVLDADPWAPQQVMLWVAPTPNPVVRSAPPSPAPQHTSH
jgi:hypothetical protein